MNLAQRAITEYKTVQAGRQEEIEESRERVNQELYRGAIIALQRIDPELLTESRDWHVAEHPDDHDGDFILYGLYDGLGWQYSSKYDDFLGSSVTKLQVMTECPRCHSNAAKAKAVESLYTLGEALSIEYFDPHVEWIDEDDRYIVYCNGKTAWQDILSKEEEPIVLSDSEKKVIELWRELKNGTGE